MKTRNDRLMKLEERKEELELLAKINWDDQRALNEIEYELEEINKELPALQEYFNRKRQLIWAR